MLNYSDLARQKRRISWLTISLVLLGVVVFGRLFSLQVLEHDHYLALATKEHLRKYEVPADRGEIYWMDGDQKSPLVLNQTLKVLYADPQFVQDKVKTAHSLASVIGDSSGSFYQALSSPGEYVVLKDKVSKDTADRILALKLPGIGLSDQPYRTYPEGNLASQALGFVNTDGEGQYGLEGYLDKQLAGNPGLLKAKTDTFGIPIATADNFIKQPVDGDSFVLTLDRNIQAQAEKYLEEGIKAVGAKSGSVLVMDPNTGAVKAMANYPTYDPNVYSSVKDYSLFGNAAVSSQFEPGSGFKVITMAAGLDTGKVTPDTAYNDTGEFQVSGRTIRNAENHKFGTQTMTDVIQKSLNTGAIFVLKTLGGDPNAITLAGKKTLYDYITKHFGFGVRTGIEQVGEAPGQVNPPSSYDVNYANMTFGQGISVTMLQMVQAVGAIANGGKLYQPHMIGEVIKPDHTTQDVAPKLLNDHVISSQASSQLSNMMIQVVEHGSGWQAKMKGYKIAGKTGTAQIPRPDGQGYIDGANIGSFVGFAPVENPKFVMMVRINEPKVSGFAESTTVPVFAHISQWLMQYYQIPPSS